MGEPAPAPTPPSAPAAEDREPAIAAPAEPAQPAPSAAGKPARDACDVAQHDARRVVLLGDAYWEANSQGIQDEMERHARAAGVLDQAESYRSYYEARANMDDIVAQYDAARREDPNIHVIIMNGGGSDILFDEQICFVAPPPDGSQCVRAVDRLVRLQREFFARLARDGVREVVFYFYPHMRNDTLAGPLLNRTVDYAAPLVREGCERAPGLNCHFVDTRPAFEDDARELIGLDGILPTDAGSRVLGEMLWNAIPRCSDPDSAGGPRSQM
jgi:hypothetical protein